MGFTGIKYHHDKALNAPLSEHDNYEHLNHLIKDLKSVDSPLGEAAAGNENEKLYGVGLEHLRALDIKADEHRKVGTLEEKGLRALASGELKRMAIFEKDFFDKFAANKLTDDLIKEFDKKDKSINLFDCLSQIYTAGLLDKTAMLVFIFTVSWTNWKYDSKAHSSGTHIHHDGTIHYQSEATDIHPIRIFIASTAAMSLVTIVTLSFQRNFYENGVKLMVSTILILFMIFYSYNMAFDQLKNILQYE